MTREELNRTVTLAEYKAMLAAHNWAGEMSEDRKERADHHDACIKLHYYAVKGDVDAQRAYNVTWFQNYGVYRAAEGHHWPHIAPYTHAGWGDFNTHECLAKLLAQRQADSEILNAVFTARNDARTQAEAAAAFDQTRVTRDPFAGHAMQEGDLS